MAEGYAVISTEALIAEFQKAIDENWGYIYGATHEMWNASRQAAYNKAKADNPDCQNSIKYGSKWYGHWVTDCSGLFAYAFKVLGGYMYHGSNTMYLQYCEHKGTLKAGKRTDGMALKPGTAVFVYNSSKKKYTHVGLYIGDGWVIEAQGTQAGVVKSKVSLSKWTNWGELKGVNYEGGDQPMPPEPTPEKGYAVVTGKNLALREGPSTNAKVLTRIPTGTVIKITEEPNDWEYVTYGNKSGFVMKQFIKEG